MTVFRNARAEEVGQILDWAAAEGWNPGLDDAQAFFAADPDGFFVATEDADPVAAISVVNHNDGFAFLGLYIVRPAFRGRGIGYELWQHALKHAGARTIGLDGVPEQQGNYAASGFVHAGATTRYAGSLSPLADDGIRVCQPDEIPELIAREAVASGSLKARYMSGWFHNTASRKTLGLDRNGRLTGFCTVRICREGAKIGPLVADNADGARRLLGHAAALFGPQVMIDVPEGAGGLTALCEALGLSPGFRTARMYRGPFEHETPEFYAVSSLELG